MKRFHIFILILILFFTSSLLWSQEKVNVVATITAYSDIAKYVGGDYVEVTGIVTGNQDAHFVRPKPSYAVLLNKANLFIETGLDLELWVPPLVDKSANPKIRSGQVGYVAAADGIHLLDIPSVADRSQGDVHIYGNPHIYTSPLNAKVIAENITIGLSKVDPAHEDYYKDKLRDFKDEIDRRLYGDELVKILGSDILQQLSESNRLIDFLNRKSFKDKKLIEYLGGWMKEMLPLHGRKLVGYHKNWVYFEQLFGLNFIGYVEPKPGIPPSPKHVERLIRNMREQNGRVIMAANYFSEQQVKEIADKVGGIAVVVPFSVGGAPGADNYFELIDYWVSHLKAAFDSADAS
jgi:zinc/manganese transport system substrate-binding protein